MRNHNDYLSTTAIGRGFVGHDRLMQRTYAPELPIAAARVAFEGVAADAAQAVEAQAVQQDPTEIADVEA